MRRRFFLIQNRRAGFGPRRLVDGVIGHLEAAGAEVARCATESEAEARGALAGVVRGRRADAVIAAGGDGTIRQVASGLAGADLPLGVIPLGTGNVLAHEIGLPRQARALAENLLTAPARPLPTATANGEVFLLWAGAGFDGRVIAALSPTLKGHIGKLAYGVPILGALCRAPDRLAIEIDGRRHEATWVVVANARHYGGRFVMAPGTRLEEPGLEAVLFQGRTRKALMAALIALARSRLADRTTAGGDVAMLPCRRVVIPGTPDVPVQVDGDVFGSTPLVVEHGGPMLQLIMPPGRSRD
jgi:YegS/Rv2252/BmrU family lipid kinase